MSATTLKKITAEAKRIRKRQPGKSWKAAVKAAGAKYRAGKISGSRRKAVGKKPTRKKKAARKKLIRTVKRAHRAEGKALSKLQSLGTVKSHARKIIDEKLEHALLRRFKAHTKTAKRKASKAISHLRAEYKKFAC